MSAVETQPRRYLDVPYAQREEAKAAGARWDKEAGQWYAPESANERALAQWAPAPSASPALADNAPAPERAFALHFPFERKDEAKSLGAMYDPAIQVWFAPKGAAEAGLAQWKVSAPAYVGSGDPQEAFAMALMEAGIDAPAPVMDGKIHRAPLFGAKGKKLDGAYVGHLDGKPSGYIQNHKTKQESKWTMPAADGGPARQGSSASHRAAWRAQIQLEGAAREEVRERLRQEVAIASQKKWDALAEKPSEPNAYLERKNARGFGVRYSGADLVVPARDAEGTIWSLQTIKPEPDGAKLFEKNGRKNGCFHLIGALRDGQDFLVAEGYATGATLHEATRLPVVVAFDAGNLLSAAQAVSEKFPRSFFCVLGDDDRYGIEGAVNTGAEKAREAARALRGGVALPVFKDIKSKPTDFNDLAKLEGLDAVAAQVKASLYASKKLARGAFHALLQEKNPSAKVFFPDWKASRQTGRVAEIAPGFVALKGGSEKSAQFISIHDARNLDKALAVGEKTTIAYKDNRAKCSTAELAAKNSLKQTL